jgi:hypothetical protein
MPKLKDLLRSDVTRYAWIDYEADAREEVRLCLNLARSNGYDFLTVDAAAVAQDLCDFAPPFEGIDPEAIVGWIREWQQEHR